MYPSRLSRFAVILVGGISAFLISSCSSVAPVETYQAGLSVEPAGVRIYPEVFEPDGSSEYVSAFFAVNAYNNLVSLLDLAGDIDTATAVDIVHSLFQGIPRTEDSLYREVAVGNYFENGDDLLIKAVVLTPQADSLTPAKRVVVIQTNAVLQNGRIDRSAGEMISLDDNLSFLYLLKDDGYLVEYDNLEDKALVARVVQAEDPVQIVNDSDYILKDDSRDNDHMVVDALTEVWTDKADEPPARVVAGLNLFLYHLGQYNLEEAEDLLGDIRELAGRLDDSDDLKRIIENEAAKMLDLMTRLGTAEL